MDRTVSLGSKTALNTSLHQFNSPICARIAQTVIIYPIIRVRIAVGVSWAALTARPHIVYSALGVIIQILILNTAKSVIWAVWNALVIWYVLIVLGTITSIFNIAFLVINRFLGVSHVVRARSVIFVVWAINCKIINVSSVTIYSLIVLSVIRRIIWGVRSTIFCTIIYAYSALNIV